MKSRMKLFRSKMSFNKSKWINIILSVVALIQVVAILMVTSYAWVETASTIIITSDGDQPIDTFVYTNAEIDQSQKGVIDLSKYYRASGNNHMASAFSGDGRALYFPRISSTASIGTNQYRPGEISDKNTNYVSFNLKIKAKGTAARFTFESDPVIKINGSVVNDSSVRVAISCGTNENDQTTKIFSKVAATATNQTINGSIISCDDVLPFSEYLSSSDGDATIFEVPKDEERIVTITVWLQDAERLKTASVDIGDLRLVPPGTKMAEVTFVDKTSRYNDVTDDSDTSGWGWTDNDNHTMWVYDIPAGELRQMTKTVNEDGYTEWTGFVQIDSIEGGGTGNLKFFNAGADATASKIIDDGEYICRWDTSFNDLKTVNPSARIYTAYANFLSQSAKTGYGTWGSVSLIILDTDGSSIPSKPTTLTDAAQVGLKILNTNTTYPMNYQDFDNDGTYRWQVFIPKTDRTDKIILNDNGTTYTINAVGRDTTEDRSTFRITYASGSGSTASGVGYWEPPAIVNVALGTNSTSAMGSVSVSGGVPGSQSVKVTAGTGVNLIATPIGDFGFYGWYTLPDCTGDPISTDSTFTITAPAKNETATYYAKFERLYTITLVSLHDEQTTPDNSSSAGGTVQINNGTATRTQTSLRVFADSSPEIKADAYVSHEFLGWFASSDWSNTVAKYGATDAHKVISSSDILEGHGLTLYARYSIKTFTIGAEARYETLDSDNNSGSTGGTVQFTAPDNTASDATATVTVNYNGMATFKANEKSSDGYEFAGWYSDQECTIPVNTSASYSLTGITENKTLYAKFNLKTYTVTAHAVSDGVVDNDSYGVVRHYYTPSLYTSGATQTTQVKHGAAVTFQAYAQSIKGTFDGWYQDSACTNQYTASADVTIQTPTKKITLTVRGNTDLYAKFTPKVYTVTAHAGSNGQVKVGDNSFSTTTSQIEVKATNSATFNAQANSGYQFDGWYSDSSYTTSVSTDAEYTKENITGNVDLYAKFVVIPEITIYYYNENNWSNVYIYCWDESGSSVVKNATWSGVKMTKVGGKVWSYTYNPNEAWATNVIFNNGSSGTGNQTDNLQLPTATQINGGYLYYKGTEWTLTTRTVTVSSVSNATVTATYTDNSGSHTINEGGTATVTVGTSVVVNVSANTGYQCNKIVVNSDEHSSNPYTISGIETNTTISATIGAAVTTKTIYFQDEAGWGAPKIHIYSSTGQFTAWNSDPTMTSAGTNNGHNVYKYEVNVTDYDTVIFHQSSGTSQSPAISISSFSTNNCIWYKSTSSYGFFTYSE